jgi:uncharacterized metal-binding protein YceD (DUF177 family)
MVTKVMKIWFHEIKDDDLKYRFTEEDPWIMEIVGSLDERISTVSRPTNWRPRSRPTVVDLTVRRVDELVHVQGKLETQLFLLCSLCAEAFSFPVERTFHALYTMNAEYGDQPREKSGQMVSATEDEDAFGEDDGVLLDSDDDDLGPGESSIELDEKEDDGADFEVTVLDEPALDLKFILNEQIVLTIPMQPKPPKDEKDDCMKCGKPQLAWTEPQKPLKENPFASALKNWKKPQ